MSPLTYVYPDGTIEYKSNLFVPFKQSLMLEEEQMILLTVE